MRWVIISLLVIVFFLTACTAAQQGSDSLTSRAIIQTAQSNPESGIVKEVYVVLIQEDSLFFEDAKRFAQYKEAEFVTYTHDMQESLEELQELRPRYLAFVSIAQTLTPDFVDDLDSFLKTIDEDAYLDVSYGILTSRTLRDFRKYIDRHIAYEPNPSLNLYGLGSQYDHYQNALGIAVQQDCVQRTFSTINCENSANASSIANGFSFADVIIIDAYGYPDHIELDNDEQLRGSMVGLLATKGDDFELLQTNASLVMATSYLTGRITGVPSQVIEGIEPILTPASIQTSIVLSTLQNGALNYIGATHPSLTNMLAQEELAELAFAQGKPLGDVLKAFKNRLIFITKNQLSGKELDTYTEKILLFSARTWVLFGDPAATLSKKMYGFGPEELAEEEEIFLDTVPCVKNQREDLLPDGGRRIEAALEGNNAFYYYGVQLRTYPEEKIAGMSKEPLCMFSVDKKDSNTVEFLTKDLLYDDLGDEYLFALPMKNVHEPLRVALKLS